MVLDAFWMDSGWSYVVKFSDFKMWRVEPSEGLIRQPLNESYQNEGFSQFGHSLLQDYIEFFYPINIQIHQRFMQLYFLILDTEEWGVLIGLVSVILVLIFEGVKYFKRPYLDLNIKTNIIPSTKKLGLSDRSEPQTFEDGVVGFDAASSYFLFEIGRKFTLIINNNSDINAHNLKIYFNANTPRFDYIDSFDDKTIIPGEPFIINGYINRIEELRGGELAKDLSDPSEFDGLQLALEYKDPNKKTFYTIYTFCSSIPTNSVNRYKRKFPKGFASYIGIY